jgi:hypothetical protein
VSSGNKTSSPVLGRSEIDIAAPPELVRDVLTTIERWPDRNPAVKQVSIRGGLAEGPPPWFSPFE